METFEFVIELIMRSMGMTPLGLTQSIRNTWSGRPWFSVMSVKIGSIPVHCAEEEREDETLVFGSGTEEEKEIDVTKIVEGIEKES